jgi:phospholipase C
MSPDVSEETARKNLAKIDHVIVLMMENRSFDHVLGYLKLDGVRPQVDGLEADMGNEDAAGKFHKVRPLGRRKIDIKALDPGHGPADVREQIAGGAMSGFLTNYVKAFERSSEDNPPPEGFKFDPTLVLSYLRADDIPVYDYLARSFQVCDRWFSSVPGPTWPNRLYAACGQAAGSKDNKSPPFYAVPSFVRELDKAKVKWRWYAHEYIATLRLTDDRYRFKLGTDIFRYFDRRTAIGGKSFVENAAEGRLPPVCWIDPNFVDVNVGPGESNDDHPPADLKAGQALVLKLYTAITSSPQWSKTLLVIVYDEHGGFYDHVQPPAAKDDRPGFRSYGPRVPALVVSPWIKRGTVASDVYDHTSIVKTILLRFCRGADGSIPNMGSRVTNANHLGGLLTLGAARAKPRPGALKPLIAMTGAWVASEVEESLQAQATGEAPSPPPPNELQVGFLKARDRLRKEGVPAGMP